MSSATTLRGAVLPAIRKHVVVNPAQLSRGETMLAHCDRHDTRRRAALLLEVLVALTILVVALAMLGSQLVAGVQMTGQAEEQTRASQLADRIMSLVELDPTIIERVFRSGQTDGDFGDDFPGWFWRVVLETTDTVGLGAVTVQVLHQENKKKVDRIEDTRIVKQLHLLKADPGRINLETDFGLAPEKIEELAAMIPIPGFDPAAIDPQALVALDPAQLLELLPMLLPLLQQMQLGGGGAGGGGNLPPALAALLGGGGGSNPFANAGGAGGMSNNFLRDFIRQQSGGKLSDEEIDQALGGMGQGGRGGGRRGGGDGDRQGDGNGPRTPDRNGFTRDSLREVLRGALGDQVTEAQLEEALDAYEQGQGNAGGNPPAPPGGNGGGNAGGRGNNGNNGNNGGNRNGGNGRSGGGGQRITDLNTRRTGGGRSGN